MRSYPDGCLSRRPFPVFRFLVGFFSSFACPVVVMSGYVGPFINIRRGSTVFVKLDAHTVINKCLEYSTVLEI